jgi:hypothetical protein
MNPSRELVPLIAADVSLFCKSLRMQLTNAEVTPLPSHLALLNMLARSAGHRNFQAMRAAAKLMPVAVAQVIPEPKLLAAPRDDALSKTARRAVTHFDTAGRLARWPTQFAVRQHALWALWVRMPAKRDMTEAEVNRYIAKYHTFEDNATLRRELINAKMLWRTRDGSVYRKEPVQPDADSAAFLKAVLDASTNERAGTRAGATVSARAARSPSR